VSSTKDAASRTGQKPPPLPPTGQRDSGTRLVGPEAAPPTHFAPLPLGSDAFMPPLAPADDATEPGSRRWLGPAAAGVAVAVFSAVLGLILWPREAAEITAEPAPATRSTSSPTTSFATRAPGAVLTPAPVSGPAPVAATTPAAASPAATPAPASGAVASATAEPAPPPSSVATPSDRPRDESRSKRSRRGSRNRDPQIDKPSRAQVIAAMAGVQRKVKACLPSGRGSITADVKVLGKTGRVTTAQIDGQRGEVGSCIARAVRKAKFPTFSAESISIRYPMAF
jgi:hypothetical protein